jgi:hypothetical protein
MKHTQMLVNWMVACCVALAMVAVANAETTESVVKVVRLKGSARYSTGKNVWQALEVGTILKAGSIIQTAASSTVDLVIAEKGASGAETKVGGGTPMSLKDYESYQPKSQYDVIRIWEDSVLAVDKLTVVQTGTDKVTDTQLDLRAGRIFFAVKKVSAASTFEIKVPNGVAGIRGTVGMASALGVFGCAQGSIGVAFKTPQGPSTKIVDTGFQFDIRTGDFSRIAPILLKEFNTFGAERPYERHEQNHQSTPPPNVHISPSTGLSTPAPQPPPA